MYRINLIISNTNTLNIIFTPLLINEKYKPFLDFFPNKCLFELIYIYVSLNLTGIHKAIIAIYIML